MAERNWAARSTAAPPHPYLDGANRGGKPKQGVPIGRWVFIVTVCTALFFLGGLLSMMGLLPENGWPEDPDSGAGLVLRGSLLKQRLEAQDKAIGHEIDEEHIEEVRRQQRRATGLQLLSAGVDMALRRLMAARGLVDEDKLEEPDMEEPIAMLQEAEGVLSKRYDGRNEGVETGYFLAVSNQALLRLYEGKCDEVDRYLHSAEGSIDLDKAEKAVVALLRGYCEEMQGSDKAGMYFSLAREFSPAVHETLLDARYQPPNYILSESLPQDRAYFRVLMDLHVFRELYGQRAALAEMHRAEGNRAELDWPFADEAHFADDKYGANVGWGLNSAGVARARDLVKQNEFVILREFLHPFELAVLERHYKARVAGGLKFDPMLGRAVDYNDRVGQYLNHRYTALIASVMDRPVKHAYSFLCHYEKRDGMVPNLRAHTDREDNQFTVSIQAYSDKESPLWPIYVDTSLTLPEHSSWRDKPDTSRAIECGMRNGDALLFLGRRHTHFRENMPADLNVVSSLLLHFVDESFDFFDYKLVRQAKDTSI